MAEDTYDEDLYDPYEARAAGNLAPVVSWKKSDVGDGFSGILLPGDPLKRPDKAYILRREYKQENKKENQAAGYTVWPPKNNSDNIKRPVVESEFVTRWPGEDLAEARKVSQVHFTFETGLVDGSLISRATTERMKENDKDPAKETRRRIIEQGKDLTEKIAAALKPLGGKPLPGQTWAFKIADRQSNEYGGETTIYEVKISAPTEETRKVVADYVAAAQQAANDAADAADTSDPYAGGAKKDDAKPVAEGPPPF
jgi:hypothetical protein